MADNRDSCYFVSWPQVSVLSNTSVFFIIGVVHEDTGKAEWENIVPMFQNNGFEHKYDVFFRYAVTCIDIVAFIGFIAVIIWIIWQKCIGIRRLNFRL